MGSLSGTARREMIIVAIGWSVGWLLLLRNARSLDLNNRSNLSPCAGCRHEKVSTQFMASVSFVTVSVCFTGAIGFVGLVIPHFSRKLMGPKSTDMYLTAPIIGGILWLCAIPSHVRSSCQASYQLRRHGHNRCTCIYLHSNEKSTHD